MDELDNLFKQSLNREFTSESKKWYEENIATAEAVKFSNVWIDEIPASPPPISTATIELVSDLILTEDTTVANQLSWLTCRNPGFMNSRLGDFIQPDKTLSIKYHVKIYDNKGAQVYLGEEDEWYFNAQNGILLFKNPPTKHQFPFHLFGYRYVGKKGTLKDLAITVSAATLDASYNGPDGDGSGRVIYTDNGPVELSASQGFAPLQIDPIDYTPTMGLKDGQICLREGIMYVYDESRSIWISMQRQVVTYGAKKADAGYMNLGDFSSSSTGWPALRKGKILGITAQASGGCPNKQIQIQVNNSTAYSFSLNNKQYVHADLNVSFESGDVLKMLVSSELATTYGLIVNVEIAWRLG